MMGTVYQLSEKKVSSRYTHIFELAERGEGRRPQLISEYLSVRIVPLVPKADVSFQ
jgi:hypothetical protein